jgi:hypothetical protein
LPSFVVLLSSRGSLSPLLRPGAAAQARALESRALFVEVAQWDCTTDMSWSGSVCCHPIHLSVPIRVQHGHYLCKDEPKDTSQVLFRCLVPPLSRLRGRRSWSSIKDYPFALRARFLRGDTLGPRTGSPNAWLEHDSSFPVLQTTLILVPAAYHHPAGIPLRMPTYRRD